MRTLKIAAASIGILTLLALAFVGKTWWESEHPVRPKGWPSGSVWLEAPHTWPSFMLVGYWVGCTLDARRNIDICRFADHKGKVIHENEYTTCDGRPPIPEQELSLQTGHQSLAFISLRNGTVLVSKDLCDARNGKL